MDPPDRKVYKTLGLAQLRRKEGLEQQAVAEIGEQTDWDERKKEKITPITL